MHLAPSLLPSAAPGAVTRISESNHHRGQVPLRIFFRIPHGLISDSVRRDSLTNSIMNGIAWLKKCLAHPSLLPLRFPFTIPTLTESGQQSSEPGEDTIYMDNVSASALYFRANAIGHCETKVKSRKEPERAEMHKAAVQSRRG